MIRFTKMHGCGNDYLFLEAFDAPIDDPSALAVDMSDRHTGVGADGIILMGPAGEGVEADLAMRIFNADGSEAEMCGNGIRCVCKYAHDHGLTGAMPMRIETGGGVLTLEYTLDDHGFVELVTVDLGEPRTNLEDVPVDPEALAHSAGDRQWLQIEATCWIGVLVSMGNPHLVIFRDEHPELMEAPLAEFDVAGWGPRLERHRAFPQRINVHFVEVHSPTEVSMRTWERGSGITRACGTGAAAVCVAGAMTGRTGREVLVHMPGGDLALRWDETTNHVFKIGPAVEVYSGEWPMSDVPASVPGD